MNIHTFFNKKKYISIIQYKEQKDKQQTKIILPGFYLTDLKIIEIYVHESNLNTCAEMKIRGINLL